MSLNSTMSLRKVTSLTVSLAKASSSGPPDGGACKILSAQRERAGQWLPQCQQCSNERCDDRVLLGSGRDYPRCEGRRADHRTQHRAAPGTSRAAGRSVRRNGPPGGRRLDLRPSNFGSAPHLHNWTFSILKFQA